MTNKKRSKKIITRILAIFLAFAMMVGTMPMTAQAISVVPFASDITNYINVTGWDLLDANGVPFSDTNPMSNSDWAILTFSWETVIPGGQTIQTGDTFRFQRPMPQTQGAFVFNNFVWIDFTDLLGVTIGRWRIQNNHVEVEFNSNAAGSASISGQFDTGRFIRSNVGLTGVQDVSFGGITHPIDFVGTTLSPLTPAPQGKSGSATATQATWSLAPHRTGIRQLSGVYGHALGTYFSYVPGFFVEDTLSGTFVSVSFSTAIRPPVSLTYGHPHYGFVSGANMLNVHFTPYLLRITPYAGESRLDFRARLQPFQWGIWEDDVGVQTFIAYFGTFGQDGPTLASFNSNFITTAVNNAINQGHFAEAERDALTDWFTTVYGSGNAIGGRVPEFGMGLVESFPPALSPRQIQNTMTVTRDGISTNSNATTTLQPVDSIVDPVSGGTVRLWLVDQETNVLLPNANFQLQIYENGSWGDVTVVGDNGIFTTGTDGSFTTPALGNGTFRFVQTTVSNAAYVLTNPLHNSFCPIEGVPVSPSFTLSGGAVGETVTVYNVRTGIQVPDLGIRKELRMPYGTTVPNATFEFDITLVSIFPTPPAITVVTIPNPTVTFNSTMTPVPHPDYPGYVYVHAYAPIDLSGITWTMPGVYRFRVTEMQNSGLASNPNYTIVYDPAVFYLYIYVGREFGDMTDPLEVLGYYARRRVPTNACDDCEEDEYCATCDYAIIKDPVLMPFKNRLFRRPATTSFEVIKEVTGRMGDTNLPFDFEVEMLLPESAFPLSNTIEATITGYARGVDGHILLPQTRVTVSTAAAISVNAATRIATHTFTLRHGDVITFTNVPVGTTYDVTESYVPGYDQSGVATEGGVAVSPPFTTTGDDDLVVSGTVSLPINETEVTNYVTVTNAHDGTPPMGVLLSNIPFGLMVALGVGALSLTATVVIVGSKVKAKKQ